MNRRFVYMGAGMLLFWEVVFYFLIKTVTDFDKVISSQKELLEIFWLIIVLLSGKLVIETISYIKESSIKNLKETINLINDYDRKIEEILENLDKFHGKDSGRTYLQSISIPKIIIFLNTLENIIDNSLDENHKKLFAGYISHLYFKTYLHLDHKKYLVSDENRNLRFVGTVKSQILYQTPKEALENFMHNMARFKNWSFVD